MDDKAFVLLFVLIGATRFERCEGFPSKKGGQAVQVVAVCNYPNLMCSDGTRCLPNDARCDRIVQCPDGSDEQGCEQFWYAQALAQKKSPAPQVVVQPVKVVQQHVKQVVEVQEAPKQVMVPAPVEEAPKQPVMVVQQPKRYVVVQRPQQIMISCFCYGHSDKCAAQGVCADCRHNTAGTQCQRCAPGYTGMATRGTPFDCRRIRYVQVMQVKQPVQQVVMQPVQQVVQPVAVKQPAAVRLQPVAMHVKQPVAMRVVQPVAMHVKQPVQVQQVAMPVVMRHHKKSG